MLIATAMPVTSTTIAPTNINQSMKRKMLLLSFLDDAPDWWHDAANIALIFSLIVGVVATFIIVRTAHIKEAGLKRDLADSLARGEAAKAEAARANERAAQLENETAKATLEQERLKAIVQWRSLTEPQGIAMAETLLAAHGTVTIAYLLNDPEAMWFGMTIEKMFAAANEHSTTGKWQLSIEPRMYSEQIVFGISIFGKSGKPLDTVRNAFRAAHVPFNEDVVSPTKVTIGAMTTTSAAPTTDVIVMIGSRRPVR